MHQPQVPKFGNWESEDDVPYTQYFDNARKTKKVGKMNPNDSQEYVNAEMKSEKGSETRDKVIQRPSHERQQSRDEGDFRRSTDSSLSDEPANRRTPHDSPHHRFAGVSVVETPKRFGRQNVGSDRSIEHSPLHPHSHVRIGGRGNGASSPSLERKGPLEGSQGMASSTPRGSRLRSVTRGDETPDHSPTVPKFGDWDENDPSSAEGFSHIFNQVREEKQSGVGKVPSMPNVTPYYANGQKKIVSGNPKSCGCFPWGRK